MLALLDLPGIEAEQRRRSESLSGFVKAGWHVLEEATPLEWNWHHDALCDHLQEAFYDWVKHRRDKTFVQRAQNIVFNVPPGTMKSRILNVFFPAWVWLKWPSWKGIFLSANPDVATRDSIACRELIESDWYRKRYRPTWRMARDQNAKKLFKNTAGGWRKAAGIKAKITGERGDGLFIDDPHDAKEVISDVKRLDVINSYDQAIGNRVNDMRSSLRVIIMQRLHAQDLAGHVLADPKGKWEHVCIPMEYVVKPPCPCMRCQTGSTFTGWRDPRTVAGELLHPARFPPDVLEQERTRLGTYGYAGQMQQSPVPAEGGYAKIPWFADRYDPADLPEFSMVFQSVDSAQKAAEINDHWVIGTWGVTPTALYLLHVERRRFEYPEGKRIVRAMAETCLYVRPPLGGMVAALLIEDKSTGSSLLQEYRLETALPVVPIEPEGDKQTRFFIETPMMEAKRMRLPKYADWLPAFEMEFFGFPLSATKDQADMVSQSLKWWRLSGLIKPEASVAVTDMSAMMQPQAPKTTGGTYNPVTQRFQ